MTINAKYCVLLCLIGLLLSFPSRAQEKDSLVSHLQKIEHRFEVNFSYADRDLMNTRVDSLHFFKKDLAANIDFLEKHSSLEFSELSETAIIIKNKAPENLDAGIIQKLEQVVITDYLTKGITKKTRGTFQIDFHNLGILPGLIEPDALRTIQALPGVESVNETVSNINVRGGNNDQNLILYDGIRMYQSGHFLGLISAFNPYQTDRVSLTKNGTNPAYGNSVSSVIAMKTSDRVNTDFHGEVGINYISAHTFFDVPLDSDNSIQLAARTSFSNLFETPTFNQYYDRAFQNSEIVNTPGTTVNNNQDFSFNDMSLRWLYQISDQDRLRVNFIRIANELSFQENAVVDSEVESRQSRLDQNSRGAGANYRRQWSDRFQTELQVYFSNYELGSQNSDIKNNNELNQKNEVLESSAEINTLFYWNENFTWQNGYELTQTEITNIQQVDNSPQRGFNQSEFFRQALFSSLKFNSDNGKTSLQGGFRFNVFNKLNKVRLEPRIAYDQQILDNLQLEILGEMKSQITTQVTDFQNDFLGLEKRRWQLSDGQDLPVVESQQISLGFSYDTNGWLANIAGYLKQVDNISSQAQAFQNQYQYVSVLGSYFSRGVDVLVRKNFAPFNFWLSYGFSNNDYDFSQLPKSNFPNNVELKHSATLAGTYTHKDFHASAGLKWRSGVPFTPLTATGVDQDQFDYEQANSNNLKKYIRFDISANQSFQLNEKLKAYAGISVLNVFDRKNIINAYYEKRDKAIALIKQEALGITPNFIFRIQF